MIRQFSAKPTYPWRESVPFRAAATVWIETEPLPVVEINLPTPRRTPLAAEEKDTIGVWCAACEPVHLLASFGMHR